MGWTGIYNKPKSLKDFFFSEYNSENLEPIKCAVKGTTIYGAVKNKRTNEIFGLVVLTSNKKDEFMYKDMDDTCGPYHYDCPESILKLLTPTDNEYANNWRNECRKNATKNQGKKVSNGATIRLKEPVRFTNGFLMKHLNWWTENGGLW